MHSANFRKLLLLVLFALSTFFCSPNSTEDKIVVDPVAPVTIVVTDTVTTVVAAMHSAGKTLSFVMSNAPDGATLDSLTGKFTWITTEQQVRSWTIPVTISDGKISTSIDLIINVLAKNAQVQPFSINVAPVSEIVDFFGTNKVKLVFRLQDTGLCFVDYSELTTGYPKIKKLPGAQQGVFPVISPDGMYVTYATGPTEEYTRAPSTAWIQALAESSSPVKVADGAYVPRFIQNAENPTVLYATCALHSEPKKYTFEGCGKMLKAEFNGSSVGAPIEVYGGGSFLGGLSYDNNYFAHGQQDIFAFMYSLKNPELGVKLLHCFDSLSPQVCNTSISASNIYTNTMMYFDVKSPLVGLPEQWSTHQVFFISRFDGAILKRFWTPPEIKTPYSETKIELQIQSVTWENPEWSNHPYFAASAILTNRKYKPADSKTVKTLSMKEMVYAINLKNETFKKLVWSTDTTLTTNISMHNPWLWVERPTNFTEEPGWLDQTWYKSPSECTLNRSN